MPHTKKYVALDADVAFKIHDITSKTKDVTVKNDATGVKLKTNLSRRIT